MSRNHLPELDALVLQLLGELQEYELHMGRLVREWTTGQQLVLFEAAGRSMDRMRKLALGVPQLSPHWLMLMISHTEVMHNLWRVSKGEALDPAAEFEDHLACVGAMVTRCERLLAQGGPVLH